jgi:hypothetical protein
MDILNKHQSIMSFFIDELKFKRPRIPSGTYDIGWVEPIDEMLEMSSGNPEQCKYLIKIAVDRADKSHLTITSPKSLIKIFTAAVSENERKQSADSEKEFNAAEVL